MRSCAASLFLAIAAVPLAAHATDRAHAPIPPLPPPPAVVVTGAATASVANDRMSVSMRAEAEAPTAMAAASEVNAKTAQAIARAKAATGVDVRTTGYSTWQINERGKPIRWRAVQSIGLDGTDFGQLATLVTRMQEDGMLLSGMSFDLTTQTRRRTEDALTQQAIKSWQQRAETAASALGFGGWRPGRVTVNTGEPAVRPVPVMRAQMAAPDAAPVPPVAAEAGTTEITVTVTGDAILEKPMR